MSMTLSAPTTCPPDVRPSFEAVLARDPLQRALAAVSAVIPARATVPVLTNVLMQTRGDAVTLTGTDLDLWVSIQIPADGIEAGEVLVPAKKFAEFTRELSPSPVRLAQSGAGRLSIDSGHAHCKLLTLDPSEYPTCPQEAATAEWRLPARVIQELAHAVGYAASIEESRPILNGVLWEMRDAWTAMIATNGHKLARYQVAIASDGTAAGDVDLIVPPRFLDMVRKLFAPTDEVTVTRGTHHLTVASASVRLGTRLIEGPYPDYRRVIPADNTQRVTVERATLLSAIRRVATLAEGEGRRIALACTGDALTVGVANQDLGEARDEVPAAVHGEVQPMGFNAAYLLEILGKLPTAQVCFHLSAPERAALLTPVLDDGAPADADALYAQPGADLRTLLMPMRLLV